MSSPTGYKIILKTGDTIVAVSEDEELWQEVLDAINAGESLSGQTDEAEAEGSDSPAHDYGQSGFVAEFAERLDIPAVIVIGACFPSLKAPYIHLDKHYWETFRKNMPSSGPYAMSQGAFAATVLCLWTDTAGLKKPTLKSVTMVLDAIGVTDPDVQSGITGCEWLELHKKNIVLNPEKTDQAIAIARAYCLEKPLHAQ